MKTLIALFSCIAFVCLFSINATAQIDLTALEDADFEFTAKMAPASVSAAAANPIPINDPIKLKRNGKCYVIRCQEAPGCDKCTLFWKDENGNGKINPKKELRCRCTSDPQKECKAQAKEVACEN